MIEFKFSGFGLPTKRHSLTCHIQRETFRFRSSCHYTDVDVYCGWVYLCGYVCVGVHVVVSWIQIWLVVVSGVVYSLHNVVQFITTQYVSGWKESGECHCQPTVKHSRYYIVNKQKQQPNFLVWVWCLRIVTTTRKTQEMLTTSIGFLPGLDDPHPQSHCSRTLDMGSGPSLITMSWVEYNVGLPWVEFEYKESWYSNSTQGQGHCTQTQF